MLDRPSDARSAGTFVHDDPVAFREAVRTGRFTGPTQGQCPGRLQANLVILPAREAEAFLRFCVKNPKPCPLVGITEPGDPRMPGLGRGLDISTDLPSYRIYRDGEHVETVTDVSDLWRDDFVGFALGCSYSFEDALMKAGIPVRHVIANQSCPMYRTSIETVPAGPFQGPLVVSHRAMPPADAIRAIAICDRMPLAHGAPVHIGDPARIGIRDLAAVDYGLPPVREEGDIDVFWACGVTPQAALRASKVPFAITHDPSHMLVTDRWAESTTPEDLQRPL